MLSVVASGVQLVEVVALQTSRDDDGSIMGGGVAACRGANINNDYTIYAVHVAAHTMMMLTAQPQYDARIQTPDASR